MIGIPNKAFFVAAGFFRILSDLFDVRLADKALFGGAAENPRLRLNFQSKLILRRSPIKSSMPK